MSEKIFDADVPKTSIPKDVPSKAISLMDHRATGRGGKKYRGDGSGTVVTVSAIKTGNGYSRNILLDTRGMNGHDRSTNINDKKKKKKGKHRERSKLHPFSPICSHIYIYIHMAMYIYICIYTETDPPPRTKRRGRR